MINITFYYTFASLLFLIGLWGILLNRKNLIIMIMSIELMLLAVNVLFIVFSMTIDDFLGQLIALLVITVAAAESSIGLALLVVYYRLNGHISVTDLHLLKG